MAHVALERSGTGLAVRPEQVAPTYPASAITNRFPFNAFYPVDDVPEIDGDNYALELSGRVADKERLSS